MEWLSADLELPWNWILFIRSHWIALDNVAVSLESIETVRPDHEDIVDREHILPALSLTLHTLTSRGCTSPIKPSHHPFKLLYLFSRRFFVSIS